ncbi:MAG TPA: L-serine ammonia-lyase, partial [Chlamydiales bacterium]|nr:L-serine ammonia-lyase [Chlamydiales bacterium]
MDTVSVFEIFSIGIGPSSSHTVGPMRAARRFLFELFDRELFEDIAQVTVELYGSLAMTGKGHATDIAILLGLSGEVPEAVDPNTVPEKIALIQQTKNIRLFGRQPIAFDPDKDIQFLKGKRLPFHSNAIRFRTFDSAKKILFSQVYYSIGGGFILDHNEALGGQAPKSAVAVPFPFRTAEQLMGYCQQEEKRIWEIVLENERVRRSDPEIRAGILRLWSVMQESVQRGLSMTGELPGGLNVQRRAAKLYQALAASEHRIGEDPMLAVEWVSLFALAVNEENAAGGRVVTAPTNGSSGVIPAVLHYAEKFLPSLNEEKI